MIKYGIEIKLPTLDEYLKAGRSDIHACSELNKKYTEYCAIYANKVMRLKGLYDVILDWETENNEINPDNIFFGVKFILDGLVEAQNKKGRNFKNGRKNINSIQHRIKTTGVNRVTVILLNHYDYSFDEFSNNIKHSISEVIKKDTEDILFKNLYCYFMRFYINRCRVKISLKKIASEIDYSYYKVLYHSDKISKLLEGKAADKNLVKIVNKIKEKIS